MRIHWIILVLLAITGVAVSCETESYDEPNGLIFPVELVDVTVAGTRAVTVSIDVIVPEGVDRGVEWLQRAELSVRGSNGGMEYLRMFFDPDKGPFGLYLTGDTADPERSSTAAGQWGALLWGEEEQTVVSYVEGEGYVEVDYGTFGLTWAFSLFDVPLGEYELFARAVPLGQRDRPFVSIGSFDLRVEGLGDAEERRSALDEVLTRGSVTAGDVEFTVDELWVLYRSLVESPDTYRTQIAGDVGHVPFLRFLYLIAVRGTEPGSGDDVGEPALPDIDIAAAALDPDPWVAAPGLFLARKWQVELNRSEIATALGETHWDTIAVDQALLYLAGEPSIPEHPAEAEHHIARLGRGSLSTCSLTVYVADPTDEWGVRYQYPTPPGLEITTPEELLQRSWDGAMPILVEPSEIRASYLAGDPPIYGGPVQAECTGGGSTLIVLWRQGGV